MLSLYLKINGTLISCFLIYASHKVCSFFKFCWVCAQIDLKSIGHFLEIKWTGLFSFLVMGRVHQDCLDSICQEWETPVVNGAYLSVN